MPRPRKISDTELQALLEQGLNANQISAALTRSGRPISRQAVTKRIYELREGEVDRSEYVLPWQVSATHADGNYLYQAILSYAKWRKGTRLDERQLRLARELEEKLTALGSVMVYDPRRGFLLRGREPDDGPSLLAVA